MCPDPYPSGYMSCKQREQTAGIWQHGTTCFIQLCQLLCAYYGYCHCESGNRDFTLDSHILLILDQVPLRNFLPSTAHACTLGAHEVVVEGTTTRRSKSRLQVPTAYTCPTQQASVCHDRTCRGTPDTYISKQYVKTGDQNATAMLCHDVRAAEHSMAMPVHVRISPKYIGYLAYLKRP